VSELVHHGALVVALTALGAAGLRAAAACGASGLLRLVAAAPLVVAAMVVQALALGRVGLASEPVVLVALAVLTWLAARALFPEPATSLRTSWSVWWSVRSRGGRLGFGAGLGVWVAWTSWQLRFPHLDVDGLIYHLPLVASWMPDGNTGAASPLIEGLPVGNYPLTNEVALAWATGITHSLVWMSVWSPLVWLLVVVAGWTGLRALDVPGWVAAAAVAALAALPLGAVQLGGPLTDLPALAWAVTCAALCAAAVRAAPPSAPGVRLSPRSPGSGRHTAPRAALLGPAVVAAGLAVGTKTTPAPLLLIALAATAWTLRAHLRPIAVRVLLPSVAVGAVVGLAWMTRNLVDHGSPLWPFVGGAGADPLPPALAPFDARFLDDPSGMLRGRSDDYAETVSGGVWLLAGALVLPLLRRSRRALAFGAATVVGVLAWANAPYTGIMEPTSLAVGATRYLLPALACAAAAIAVSTAGDAPRWVRRSGGGVLVLAALVSVSRMNELGFPYTPSASTILAGALLGAALVAIAPWTSRLDRRLGISRLGPVLTGAFVALILAGQADGYLIRHAGLELFDRPLLGAILHDPTFTFGAGRTVAAAPATVGSLAGDRVQHRLLLIPRDEPCARTRERVAEGWVLAQIQPATARGTALVACMQGLPETFRDGRYVLWTRTTIR